MEKQRALNQLEPDPFGVEEAALIRSPYHDDVKRLLDTLNFYLPTYQERLGAETYALIRDNLQVLTECFYGEPLTPEAVEVLHLHLDTLSRMLALKLN